MTDAWLQRIESPVTPQRRAAAVANVLMSFMLPSGSSIGEFLNSTLFNSFQYGATLTTGVGQDVKSCLSCTRVLILALTCCSERS
jgi:hypothetical protein